jgi:ABC-type glycerol-3-phosphate transport system substrate-binding protein
MQLKRSRFLMVLVLALLVGLVIIPTAGIHAQDGIVLSVVFPEFMRNVLGEDTFTQFEADNPGVKVNVVYGNMDGGSPSQDLDGYLQGIQDYVSKADVVSIQSSEMSVEGTRAGYFLDLSPLTSTDSSLNADDFIPAVWQSFQWDGGVWALPVSTDVVLIVYDPAAFDKAGLAYPNAAWTIDDFANAAQKLTQRHTSGAVTTPGLVTFNGTPYLLHALLGQGVYDNSSGTDAPAFSSAALETLLTTWAGLETDGVVATFVNGDINRAPLRIFSSRGLSITRGANATTPA